MSPKIAIILLSYNGFDLTKKCLEHLRKVENDIDYSLFLVDNCSSSPDECEKLKSLSALYDHFEPITDSNRGFSGGMNFGAEKAMAHDSYDYVVYYSNDIFPKPGFLKNLIGAMEGDKKIGLAGPIQYKYQSDKVQFAGSRISRWKNVPHHLYEISENSRVDWVNGAVFAISRDCLKQTGGLDLSYFNWYEDCDLSFRAVKLGWKLAIIKESVVEHMAAQTVGGLEESKITHKTFYHARNRIIFVARNRSYFEFLVFLLYFLFIDTPRFIYKEFYFDSVAFKIIGARFRGIFAAFCGSRQQNKLEKPPTTMRPQGSSDPSLNNSTPEKKKRLPVKKEFCTDEVIDNWKKITQLKNSAKVAIYGAGKHTVWLEKTTKTLNGPEVTAILDDQPNNTLSFWGLTPRLIGEWESTDTDIIVLSSDTHQKKMRKRCHKLFGKKVTIIDLYRKEDHKN